MTKPLSELINKIPSNVNIEATLAANEILEKKMKIIEYFKKKLNHIRNNKSMLCPFHKEKTPSFTYNKLTGGFFCFGCGKTGNISQESEKIQEYLRS